MLLKYESKIVKVTLGSCCPQKGLCAGVPMVPPSVFSAAKSKDPGRVREGRTVWLFKNFYFSYQLR